MSFAFYMNCYHLADWVRESGANTKEELKDFFKHHLLMELCHDFCDGVKHCRLDTSSERARKRPRVNPHWTTVADTETPMPPEPVH